MDKSIFREAYFREKQAPGMKKFNFKMRDLLPFANADKLAQELSQCQVEHMKRLENIDNDVKVYKMLDVDFDSWKPYYDE